ncbi:hypothetical protein GDO81_022126 [Engystomops pustulosus]|uniref:Sulfotransferase n=1 Tax=Engystomops pustulosus TaxID=76066 RepID=A0AAV6ZB83_ENGPU|nr:hypothetical protein GDO81_022126 [Engystomops pustulosus]
MDTEWHRKDWVKVRGVPIVWPFTPNWERIDHFRAREDDIVIATYPKSGTTWMSEIVDAVLNDGDIEKCQRDVIFQKVPMLEFCVPGAVPPGTGKLPTFFSVTIQHILTWRGEEYLRTVQCLYHWIDEQSHPRAGSREEYVEKFLCGNVGDGPWGTHVKESEAVETKKNILMTDPKREIRKVMTFLGKDLSEDVLDKICLHTSFKAMKENPTTNYTPLSSAIMDQSVSPFMRKGRIRPILR